MSRERKAFPTLAMLRRGGVSCPGCGTFFWSTLAMMEHQRGCEVIQSAKAAAMARYVRRLADAGDARSTEARDAR